MGNLLTNKPYFELYEDINLTKKINIQITKKIKSVKTNEIKNGKYIYKKNTRVYKFIYISKDITQIYIKYNNILCD